jgi:hypothetical protein
MTNRSRNPLLAAESLQVASSLHCAG